MITLYVPVENMMFGAEHLVLRGSSFCFCCFIAATRYHRRLLLYANPLFIYVRVPRRFYERDHM